MMVMDVRRVQSRDRSAVTQSGKIKDTINA